MGRHAPDSLDRTTRRTLIAATIAVMIGSGIAWVTEASEAAGEPGPLRIALAVYGEVERVCYATAFLEKANRDTTIRVAPAFEQVDLTTPTLPRHPYLILTGDRRFHFTETERDRLRDYWRGGGFVLASAACGSRSWTQSFRREVRAIHPGARFAPLPLDHPAYRIIYDLQPSDEGGQNTPALEAVHVGDRLIAILCPRGLNDTDDAAGDCCCCGGVEYKHAVELNVNLLAYAMTH